ncbi:MAG TPA: hypothetical protein VIF14_12700 [Alphaproteobacteria bacterium]|jgi:hypothetical protein
MDRPNRLVIARKRIHSVLTRHGIALARTLEQKISDAGPNPQRIDPHILTEARAQLIQEGIVVRRVVKNVPWFALRATPVATLEQRLKVQLPIHDRIQQEGVKKRLGQSLEIAVFRALSQRKGAHFLGGFPDLDAHDDSELYRKEEPPLSIGTDRIRGGPLDFVLLEQGIRAGIEAKNIRDWVYPAAAEVKEVLRKCVQLDAVPVLIARRIHFSAFLVLNRCGAIVHQNYNQLFPHSEAELANQAKHKNLLGYHDIRTANEPDQRLITFITNNLPAALGGAREKFLQFRDLIESYATDQMNYEEFAGRVRRRTRGKPEDGDSEADEPGGTEPDF